MRKLALLALLSLVIARPARADEEWYGWQIMLADAASFGFMLQNRDVPVVVGLVGFALGGPIIHFAHEDAAQGGIDLALRVGLPFAGAAYGGSQARCTGVCDGPGPALFGLLAGAGATTAVDYIFLSRHHRAEPRSTWTSVAPTKGGALLSLSGRF